ncbi:MAG: zinc ribbon domain-containing protein [Theionarchaea archaeon]|nr:zinc ribbon domain-containing protein [Theionarchaea archaeon]
MVEKEEALMTQLPPIILGMLTDSILKYIEDINGTDRVLFITGMGVVYSILYYAKKRKAKKKSLKCAKCGFKNPLDSKFCSRCGVKL